MKRMYHLYEEIYKFSHIDYCFKEVCKHAKNKTKVTRFKDFKCINIYQIYDVLKNKKYVVGKPNIFYIYEPKKRRIVSQNMFDKTVNHLVSRYILYPALLPCLILENCASCPNKGSGFALELFFKYNRICKKKYQNYYILKCDIKSYFASIDHVLLKKKLERRIKDKDALEIIYKMIDCEENGLSIGFMSSQILGIFYLNDFDHYVKEVLKIKYYVRYQDDFLLFHKDKEYLKECLEKIKEFLHHEKLYLNNKTRIFKNTNNFVYLGRTKKHHYAKYRLINKKIKTNKKLYLEGKITFFKLVSSYICYKSLNKIDNN